MICFVLFSVQISEEDDEEDESSEGEEIEEIFGGAKKDPQKSSFEKRQEKVVRIFLAVVETRDKFEILRSRFHFAFWRPANWCRYSHTYTHTQGAGTHTHTHTHTPRVQVVLVGRVVVWPRGLDARFVCSFFLSFSFFFSSRCATTWRHPYGASLQLKEKISELEAAALQEKPWQLAGEVSSSARPENSLLQEHLDYEQTTKAGKVIQKAKLYKTATTCLNSTFFF